MMADTHDSCVEKRVTNSDRDMAWYGMAILANDHAETSQP